MNVMAILVGLLLAETPRCIPPAQPVYICLPPAQYVPDPGHCEDAPGDSVRLDLPVYLVCGLVR